LQSDRKHTFKVAYQDHFTKYDVLKSLESEQANEVTSTVLLTYLH